MTTGLAVINGVTSITIKPAYRKMKNVRLMISSLSKKAILTIKKFIMARLITKPKITTGNILVLTAPTLSEFEPRLTNIH